MWNYFPSLIFPFLIFKNFSPCANFFLHILSTSIYKKRDLFPNLQKNVILQKKKISQHVHTKITCTSVPSMKIFNAISTNFLYCRLRETTRKKSTKRRAKMCKTKKIYFIESFSAILKEIWLHCFFYHPVCTQFILFSLHSITSIYLVFIEAMILFLRNMQLFYVEIELRIIFNNMNSILWPLARN